MSHECYKCDDYLEDRQICYVCFQQMKKRIETLEAELKRITCSDCDGNALTHKKGCESVD